MEGKLIDEVMIFFHNTVLCCKSLVYAGFVIFGNFGLNGDPAKSTLNSASSKIVKKQSSAKIVSSLILKRPSQIFYLIYFVVVIGIRRCHSIKVKKDTSMICL